tara:strand:- start:15227 stop:15517 length:291 start_codon:yes stop_codon:yes gene_type:complete
VAIEMFEKHSFIYYKLKWNFMALTCNIGAAGKVARLRTGILGVAGGLGLAVLVATGILPTIGWWAVAASVAGGSFSIWEARAGWCVVRAMGFKTPV